MRKYLVYHRNERWFLCLVQQQQQCIYFSRDLVSSFLILILAIKSLIAKTISVVSYSLHSTSIFISFPFIVIEVFVLALFGEQYL